MVMGNGMNACFVADWSVNKNTYEEFANFLVDCGYDVKIDGFNLTAIKGKRKIYLTKGFKGNKEMLKLTKRFNRER